MRTYTRAKPSWLAIALTLTINHALAGDNTDQAGDSGEEKLPPLELLGFLADFSDESGWVDPAELDGMFGEQDKVPADQDAEEAVAEESNSEELLPPDELEQGEGVAHRFVPRLGQEWLGRGRRAREAPRPSDAGLFRIGLRGARPENSHG